MFDGCSSLETLDTELVDTSKVTDMSHMFWGCNSLTSLELISFNTSNVTNMSFMFDSCINLVSLDISKFNTSKVKYMMGMFHGCSSLTNLNLYNFNTSNVEYISHMFDGCSSLKSLNLLSFNTEKANSFQRMFANCTSLETLKIGNFDTTNVTDMQSMFLNCSSLKTLDLNSFNTENTLAMIDMFAGCTSLEELEIGNFNLNRAGDTLRFNLDDLHNLLYLRAFHNTTSNLNLPVTLYNSNGVAFTYLDSSIDNNTVLAKKFSLYDGETLIREILFGSKLGVLPNNPAPGYHLEKWYSKRSYNEQTGKYTYSNPVNGNTELKNTRNFDIDGDKVYLYSNYVLNKYKVTFVDDNDQILKEETEYDYGTSVNDIGKPENPNKEGNAQYSYSFSGWNPTLEDVTRDITYKATYTRTVNKYTVTWKNSDGTNLEVDENVEYGSHIEYNGPTLGNDSQIFVGWFRNLDDEQPVNINNITVEGDLVLYAKFTTPSSNVSLSKDVDAIDFGEVLVNFENRVQRNVTIKNTGNVAVSLGINNPTSSGPFASLEFEIGKELEPGEEYIVKLIADPGRTYCNVPGTYNGNYQITATSVEDEEDGFVLSIPATLVIKSPSKSISYKTHVQTYGWQDYVSNGETSGTEGEAKRLEGIKIKLDNQDYDGDIEYRTHIQSYGWEAAWKKNNQMSGTSGEAKRLEAIEIKLTGKMAEHYDVYYRVHAQKFGWLGWARNGESAGTAGFAYRLEAIQIILVDKNDSIDEYGEKEAFKGKSIEYTTHVQTYGWQDYAYDGNMAGTSGEAKRLEAIKIKLSNQKYTGNVEYKTHIQTYGWEQEFKKNDEMSGTSGEAKRLEAIEIKLTGEMEKHYDIYYRVHAQTYGWLNWAKNGEKSGTAGYAKRLEGIEIVLVNKGQSPPVRDNQNNEKAFISFEEENQQVTNYSVDDPKISNLINNILSRTITLDYNSNALDTIYTKDVKVLTSDIESIVAYRAVEDNFIDKNVVSLDEMKNSIKKYFGKDYVFNPDTLDLNNRCAFFGYDSNTKIFTKNGGGCGSTTGPSSTYKIVKAVDINGTLKLNVKVIFANSTTKKYYSDYNKTNVISDFDEEGYSDRDEYGNHTEAYLNYLDSLLNQGSNYQFTFKLENNNYVFVSSEPIN